MKVAYVSIGMWSALNSAFELARRLTVAGHEVVFLSQADIEPQVLAQGHAFVPLVADREPAEQEKLRWRDLARPSTFLRRLRRRRRLRQEAVDAMVAEVRARVEAIEPDLVILDIEKHVAILALDALPVPKVLVMVWFSVFRRPGLPPLHLDRRPATTPKERLGEKWAWIRLRLETLHMEQRRRLDRLRRAELFSPPAYDSVDVDELRWIARRVGFSTGRRTSRAHWLRPWVYTDLPTLSFNDRRLEFPHDPPAHLCYVGPMVHRDRREAQVSGEDRRAWETFRAERDPERPLVYASLGTYWSADVGFLRRLAAVFARRRDWDLVLGLGGVLDAEALHPITSNVLILRFAPQLEALRLADAAVTHGGIGTLNECLLHRVPMVVYSTKFVDQDGCAARMAYHALAVVGDKDRDDEAQLERHVERALTDPELRSRVTSVGDDLLAAEKQGTAVALLEELAGLSLGAGAS